MRTALAVTLALAGAAACGGPGFAPPPVHPTSAATPASDLATAKTTPPAATDAGGHLATKDPRVVDLDVIRIRAVPRGVGGEPEMETTSTTELFNAATAAAKAGHTDEAIDKYRQLVAEFPDSGFAPVSLFNIAAIYDGRGDPDQTIATLRDLVAKYPDSRESIDGNLYIAAVQADHRQYADCAATIDGLLARAHLTYTDRLEADARKGYVLIELGRLDDADAALDAALAEWRAAPHVDDPFYVAMASYYKGEVAHRRFLAAPVRLPDDQLVADLDAKRVLVVRAYDAWKGSLDFKQGYWSTAAGYQMSEIFEELWEAEVTAPYPARIDTGTRATYVQRLHADARKELEKALEGHRMNVELAKAYGIDTDWSRGSAQQAAKIMGLLADEAAGRYVTP
jgi:TolA-binding protein|nr:tetratricopeptide repeat protein [Kofleriaceae bacterium]